MKSHEEDRTAEKGLLVGRAEPLRDLTTNFGKLMKNLYFYQK
jgi:hypothetical protein